MQRAQRQRTADPRSVPWRIEDDPDLVGVDTTWGRLQEMQCAPGVRTVGELELTELVESGAALVDSRVPGSTGGMTILGAVSIPHDQAAARIGDLDTRQVSILFCNGPQCPQSPEAIRALLDHGFPAGSLAYYRGGMHDWITLAMPTKPTA